MSELSGDVIRDVQVGGNHYKSMKIQPIEFSQVNNLNACEFSVIKYVCRHRTKSGAQDVMKAIHFAQILLKLEYGVESSVTYGSDSDRAAVGG